MTSVGVSATVMPDQYGFEEIVRIAGPTGILLSLSWPDTEIDTKMTYKTYVAALHPALIFASTLAHSVYTQNSLPNLRRADLKSVQNGGDFDYSVDVNLGKNRIMLGEPIILHYVLTQNSNARHRTVLNVPYDQAAPWLKVKLVDESGTVVTSVDLNSVQGIAAQSLLKKRGVIEFPSTGFVDDIILGGTRLPIPKPGRYHILVEASDLMPLPSDRLYNPQGFTIGGDLARKRAQNPAPSMPTARYSLSGSFSLLLEVTRQSDTLRNLARIAAETIASGPLVSTRVVYLDAVRTLFTLSGPIAGREQISLTDDLTEQPENYYYLMNAIAHLGTPEAADFLAKQYWNRNRKSAEEALVTMHAFGNQEIRSYIANLFSLHHQTIPRPVMDM